MELKIVMLEVFKLGAIALVLEAALVEVVQSVPLVVEEEW